ALLRGRVGDKRRSREDGAQDNWIEDAFHDCVSTVRSAKAFALPRTSHYAHRTSHNAHRTTHIALRTNFAVSSSASAAALECRRATPSRRSLQTAGTPASARRWRSPSATRGTAGRSGP